MIDGALARSEMAEPHSAEKIRKITQLVLNDALQILMLIALLRKQNTGGINARLSKAGAANANVAARNAMIANLVLLISRAYAEPRAGDLHLRVAAELLKGDNTAREIFDSANRPKKVGDFEACWAKYTAHLGEPRDLPEPEYKELFEFGNVTVEAIELLALATGVAAKSIRDNNDAEASAEAFWSIWAKD
jgi:hypothetical protein